jgi:ABC-type dipeptide/oligopeptide/nickel transport system permease component
VVTVMGLEFGALLTGAVITETVFSWPGIGRLAVDSIGSRDYPVVQAAVIFTAGLFVLINFVVDCSYAVLDPTVMRG